jgi:hypothetical protein
MYALNGPSQRGEALLGYECGPRFLTCFLGAALHSKEKNV